MSIFGFGKKKEAKETACCCGTSEKEVKEPVCSCSGNAETSAASEGCCCGEGECRIKSVKVLGSGCRSCHELYEASSAAVRELGMDLEVEYITDMEKIMSYGVMSMPALVVNGKVVSMGKVLKPEDVIRLLKKLRYC